MFSLSPETSVNAALMRVEFVLNDHRQDLVGESVDVAMRIGALTDSTGATARKIGVSHRVLAASPGYLAKHGTPVLPGELATHTMIVGPAGRGSEGWVFRKGGAIETIRVEGRFVLDGTEGATAAAAAGLGIVSTGHLGCLTELRSGPLVRVLADWQMGSGDINVILPAGRAAKPSARAFADFMTEEFKELNTAWVLV